MLKSGNRCRADHGRRWPHAVCGGPLYDLDLPAYADMRSLAAPDFVLEVTPLRALTDVRSEFGFRATESVATRFGVLKRCEAVWPGS